MESTIVKVLGVMSGTSLDGVDLALIRFQKNEKWSFEMEITDTISYPENWKKELGVAINYNDEDLKNLNSRYTHYLGSLIAKFIEDHGISNLDAVCSHGHTIKHEPENNYTLQIGNLPELAQLTGCKVVCDFRVQDVELGGQGAPLVPIGDELLFPQFKYCLNLGGFANISTNPDGDRNAYDICPVNTVLNFYAEKLGLPYDEDGKIARSGNLKRELLQKLERLAFYEETPPKSLGMEWVNKNIFPLLKDYEKNEIPSVLHTFSQHIASQISDNLDDDPSSEVLVTGGGAFNSYLIELIKQKTKTKLEIPSDEIINFKEALIFGFLGVLKMRNEINVLSSVTGAEKDHSSGVIFEP